MTLVTYFVQRFFFDDCLLSITYDTWKNKNKNKFKKSKLAGYIPIRDRVLSDRPMNSHLPICSRKIGSEKVQCEQRLFQ